MITHSHNLLTHEHAPEVRLRKKRVRVALEALGVLALLLIAAGAILAIPAIGATREIYDNAMAGRDDLDRAKAAGESLDFAMASSALGDASAHFQAGEDGLARLGLVAKLPYVAREVAGVRGLLEGGRNTADALKEAVDVGADMLAVLKSGAGSLTAGNLGLANQQQAVGSLSVEDRRSLLQKMTEAPDRLGLARAALDRAIASFDGIADTPLTAGILASIRPQVDRLRELRGFLSQDLSALAKIPKVVGYPTPKTYLFLLLNNTELRPGGGFIGTYGVVKVADGALTSFFTDDVYAIDGPSEAWMKESMPAPIAKYLKTPSLFMRDANWSPDFAVSALNVERLYHLERGPEAHFDGVIGVTPTVISKLLDITGPITIGNSAFTSANITDELEYQVEKGFVGTNTPYFQRKGIVGDLGEELIKRLMALPVSRLPELAVVAQSSIDEKHLMATFDDADLQAYAAAHDWSGQLPVDAGDTLTVVDANMAALKTDPAVERTVSYGIHPDGDGFVATASMKYAHHGRFDWKTSRYRTYARFYVPLGSTLIKGEGMLQDDKIYNPKGAPGTIDVSTDLGRTVFGGFISIEPGATKTLSVTYRLPAGVTKTVNDGTYRLDVHKQLGTINHGLTLDLDFGKKLSNAMPPEDASHWGDARYALNIDLRLDRTFTVDLAR